MDNLSVDVERLERRIGQRFAFNLPVALREVSSSSEGVGVTQNVGSRGVFLFTEMPLGEGAEIELTLKMPSEVTLGESMHVRCRGRVLRVVRPVGIADSRAHAENTSGNKPSDPTSGIAICIRNYEYLPEAEDSSAEFRRISALHHTGEAQETVPVAVNSPGAAHPTAQNS